jgi:hypothetical protein
MRCQLERLAPCFSINRCFLALARPTILAFTPVRIGFHTALRTRTVHTFFSPKVYQPLPYKDWNGLVRYYIRSEDVARTVQVGNVRPFAIEEDIRQLFIESDFHPELILMIYDAEVGHTHSNGKVTVLLKSPEQARQAIKDLDGAIMFDQKLVVVPYNKARETRYVEFYWGWYAVPNPSLFKQRAPILKPPLDVSGMPTRMEANCFLTRFPGFRTAERRTSHHIRTCSIGRRNQVW